MFNWLRNLMSSNNKTVEEPSFEFLFIYSDEPAIKKDDFDKIMTPDSFSWNKVVKNDWDYYQVDKDEFYYSFEIVGIQMVFNKGADFAKAQIIANEVSKKLSEYCKSEIKLEIITNDFPVSF